MCISCWKVYTYDKIKCHRQLKPEHEQSIITSKQFGSANKYKQLSKTLGKCEEVNGEWYFYNPFQAKRKPYKKRIKRNKEQIEQKMSKEKHKKLVSGIQKDPILSPTSFLTSKQNKIKIFDKIDEIGKRIENLEERMKSFEN